MCNKYKKIRVVNPPPNRCCIQYIYINHILSANMYEGLFSFTATNKDL